MELIKQKSKEVSETDILLKAMKDLLNKLEEEGREEGRRIEEEEREMPML